MKEIVSRLMENKRLSESTRPKSIKALCDELKSIIDTSYRNIEITPDINNNVAIMKYNDTGETYYVSPGVLGEKDKNAHSYQVIDNYPGAVLKDGYFYDKNGEMIGRAVVRISKTSHPKDYSPDMKDATISKKIV